MACLPLRAKRLSRPWSKRVFLNESSPWQATQPCESVRALNWPPCGSRWQVRQSLERGISEERQARLDGPALRLEPGPDRGGHLGLEPLVLGVAPGAGHGAVGPLELVGELVVVLGLEADRHEAVHGVAALAGLGRRRGEGDLAEVGIEVAVDAAVELEPAEDRLALAPWPVAGVAPDQQVGAAQGVAGLLVEELLLADAVHLLPVVGGVAGAAVEAEAALVRVLVAVGADLERDRLVPDEERRPHRRRPEAHVAGRGRGLVGVALQAGDLGVLELQPVGGPGVVEAGRLPPLRGVALLAVGAELAAVLVEVAGGAGDRLSQLALAPLEQHLLHRGIGDAPAVMALGAVGLAVLPLQRVAGAGVVEALLPARAPVDQLGLGALVLVVAGLAGPLLRLEPPVESLAADIRLSTSLWQARQCVGLSCWPASWHLVQFERPASAAWGLDRSPGEKTSALAAVDQRPARRATMARWRELTVINGDHTRDRGRRRCAP